MLGAEPNRQYEALRAQALAAMTPLERSRKRVCELERSQIEVEGEFTRHARDPKFDLSGLIERRRSIAQELEQTQAEAKREQTRENNRRLQGLRPALDRAKTAHEAFVKAFGAVVAALDEYQIALAVTSELVDLEGRANVLGYSPHRYEAAELWKLPAEIESTRQYGNGFLIGGLKKL